MGNILSFVSDGAAVSADALKLAIENNIAATIATIGLVIYFLCTAVVFIVNPIKFGRNYSVQPVDNAGKTEIRVYYGGISFALGLFLAVLAFVFGHPFYSLVGGLIFANTVFFTRLTFTFHASPSPSWTRAGTAPTPSSPSPPKAVSSSCSGSASPSPSPSKAPSDAPRKTKQNPQNRRLCGGFVLFISFFARVLHPRAPCGGIIPPHPHTLYNKSAPSVAVAAATLGAKLYKSLGSRGIMPLAGSRGGARAPPPGCRGGAPAYRVVTRFRTDSPY